MTYSKIARVSLLLFTGCWLSIHGSVRAEDNTFDALIDQIFDRSSDDDSEDEKPEPEIRPFPGNLSIVVGGGQRVVGQSVAERFGVSAIAVAGREDRPEVPVIWASPAVDKLQRLLAKPLKKEGFKFKGTPLSEVADFVRQEYEIKVRLDLRSLDDLGLSPDDKLDANLSKMSLGEALKIALLKVELTYILAHDTVVIVSEEEALDWPLVGIYPVGDLLEVQQDDAATSKTKGLAQHPEDIAHLKEIVEATCGADSWGDADSDIVAMQPSLLIVRHREEVHVEIQDLLSALRLAKQHRFAKPLEHAEKEEGPKADVDPETESKEESGNLGGGGIF